MGSVSLRGGFGATRNIYRLDQLIYPERYHDRDILCLHEDGSNGFTSVCSLCEEVPGRRGGLEQDLLIRQIVFPVINFLEPVVHIFVQFLQGEQLHSR